MRKRRGALPEAARGEEGMALVLTLMVTAILVALVTEFVYGVYVNTGFLHNWQLSQELSRSARSGVSVAAYFIEKETSGKGYTYPGSVYLPPADPFMDGASMVGVKIEDEDSKFNLNSMVEQNGELDQDAYEGFKRLLSGLSMDEALADRVLDWLDPDGVPRAEGSEEGARNAHMTSTEELSVIPGVGREVYDKLSDYVTVFGSGLVNINGAEVPVLMSLSVDMDEDLAERVVSYRDSSPFEDTDELQKVAGFESLGISLIGKINVKGTAFRVVSTAESQEGVKAITECVLDSSGKIGYWKEH